MGSSMSFANFRGREENPYGSTTNLKKKFLYKILNIFSLFQISSLNNQHFFLSLYSSFNNVVESSLLPNLMPNIVAESSLLPNVMPPF